MNEPFSAEIDLNKFVCNLNYLSYFSQGQTIVFPNIQQQTIRMKYVLMSF